MLRRLSLIAIAFLGMTAPTRAYCIDDCMAAQDCSLNYSGACSSALSDCSSQCMNQSSGPAFGALAFGRKSEAWGYAFNKNSEAAASALALKNCAANGDDCEVMVTFSDACAALAAGHNGTASIVASVISDTQDAAQSKAVTRCKENGGEGCEVQVWSCSGR